MKIPIFSFGKLTELLKYNYKLAIEGPFGMLPLLLPKLLNLDNSTISDILFKQLAF
jgi:hypothetical protein